MEYKNETRSCQNCKNDFTIEPDDFSFYEKIKVPPPTFCPECRSIRRMSFTNERVLYKRKCDLTGENIFSMYGENTNFPVYETTAWYSDKWDPYSYGIELDLSKPFLSQLKELYDIVPRMSLVKQGLPVNSPYTHRVTSPKNSYMVFRSIKPENCLYSYFLFGGIDCCDSMFLVDCERCYECIDCERCYNLKFSQESKECRDSFFLFACRNCTNCIGCVNLINQEYCIFNIKYSKEDYFTKLSELGLNSYKNLKEFEIIFEDFRKKFPHRYAHILKSQNTSGNWNLNSKNVEKSFFCTNVENGKYLFSIIDSKDCMDYYSWGANAEMVYESENCGMDISHILFSNQCWANSRELIYCYLCIGSSNCFGSVGVRKGEYVILNKKYTKEKYFELLPKIIKNINENPYVDGKGNRHKFGEHLPYDFSEFSYNETAANDYYPLDKEEAINQGYRWIDKKKNSYAITILAKNLPDSIDETDDSIIKEVVECEEKDQDYSTGAYKITENEFLFYKKMDLPVPRNCFDVRHKKRLNKRPLMNIISRNCTKCNSEVSTIYTEKYAPILYCEKCYQQEVY